MAKKPPITHQRLKEVLHYDPETGIFTWLMFRGGKATAGIRAGRTHYRGYRYIKVKQVAYAEHRLAWLYMIGKMPADQIDHINGDKADNRFSNLREATNSQNHMNRPVRSDSRSQAKGVKWLPANKKWTARIQVGNKRIYLGFFTTMEEAAEAYRRGAEKYFGEFARV